MSVTLLEGGGGESDNETTTTTDRFNVSTATSVSDDSDDFDGDGSTDSLSETASTDEQRLFREGDATSTTREGASDAGAGGIASRMDDAVEVTSSPESIDEAADQGDDDRGLFGVNPFDSEEDIATPAETSGGTGPGPPIETGPGGSPRPDDDTTELLVEEVDDFMTDDDGETVADRTDVDVDLGGLLDDVEDAVSNAVSGGQDSSDDGDAGDDELPPEVLALLALGVGGGWYVTRGPGGD